MRSPRQRHLQAAQQRQRRLQKPWLQWYRLPAWRAYRAEYLALNPRCIICGAPSEIVDHIKPHKGDESVFWNAANHQPLCKVCHDSKTARFDGGGGRAGKSGAAYSLSCGEDGFPVDPNHPFNAEEDDGEQ